MSYKKYSTVKGYTIIEILLVVAIIGLLASIILVNAGTLKIKAQRSAAFTELANALRAVETCMLSQQTMYCDGTAGSQTSGNDCTGDATASSRPVSGTALCGDGTEYATQAWPSMEKNNYRYASHAGSYQVQGLYTVGIYRGSSTNDIPEDGKVICCNNEGCQEFVAASNVGSFCRSLAGMTGLED